MMNRFFTLLLAASCLTAVGQTEYPYPYNPDGNNDGYISLNDLLDLLSVYGSEFNAGVLATDSLSAIFYTGEMDYWDCASSCVGLKGNWKVLDHHLIGSYREVLSETADPAIWVDHTQFKSDGGELFPVLRHIEDLSLIITYSYYPSDASSKCFCQTRTRADIEDINVCEGLEDECGVCNGEGAIYECGCSGIPEGDCDCEGNQLDAIGVCGGDCLEDADGDGICDPVVGPCEGEDFITYHGVDYEIVETADGRCWFAENLKTSFYSDGTDIDVATQDNLWPRTQYLSPSYRRYICCLEHEGTFVNPNDYCWGYSCNTSLPEDQWVDYYAYNYQAVRSESGLCPSGWHVPNVQEWQMLHESYGGGPEGVRALIPDDFLSSNPCNYDDAPVPVYDYGGSGLNLSALAHVEAVNGAINTEGQSIAIYWSSDLAGNSDFETGARTVSLGACNTNIYFSVSTDQFMGGHPIRCIKD